MRNISFTGPAAVVTCSIFTIALASGCGTEHLPPPTPPTREVPKDVDIPTEPPPNGTGRVVLDANGDRAKVVEITGSATAAAGNYRATIVGIRPLCTTQCDVDLPYGSHPLVLRSTTDESRVSELDLDVGPRPKVVRHALGERKDGGIVHTFGASMLGLGTLTALTGVLLWGVGAIASRPGHESSLTGTGQIITGIGVGGMLISIPLLMTSRPTERPGATTEWSVPPGGSKEPAPLPQGVSAQNL